MADSKLTTEQVADYLRDHPDFFAGQDELLKLMRLPHQSGQVVSLLERQNELLRRDLARQRERLQHLVATALDNDHLFLRLRTLVLRLLETTDWTDTLATLQREIIARFDVDQVRILAARGQLPDASNPVMQFIDNADLPEPVRGVLSSDKPWCGALNSRERTRLLDGEGDCSVALAPLSADRAVHGVLVLMAEDAGYFHAGMDTVFLMHLADVLVRLGLRQGQGQGAAEATSAPEEPIRRRLQEGDQR